MPELPDDRCVSLVKAPLPAAKQVVAKRVQGVPARRTRRTDTGGGKADPEPPLHQNSEFCGIQP